MPNYGSEAIVGAYTDRSTRGPAGNGATPRSPLAAIGDCLSQIHSQLDELEAKLAPVLGHAMEPPCGEKKDRAHNMLYEILEASQDACDKLGLILRRIEL